MRPLIASEFGKEIRQSPAPDMMKQITTTEGTINEHGDAALLRQREDFFFCFPFHDRVIDLDEVEFFSVKNFCDLSKGAGLVMGHTDIPQSSLSFPFPHRAELSVDIDQVM